MQELTKAALTAFFAILVLVAGEILKRFIIDPIQEQKRVIGEISLALVVYQDLKDVDRRRRRGDHRVPSPEEITKIEDKLRLLAGQLQATIWTIPFYDFLSERGWVKSKERIINASKSLYEWAGLIRNARAEDTNKKREQVQDNLNLGLNEQANTGITATGGIT